MDLGSEDKMECLDGVRKLIEMKDVDIKSELLKGHELLSKVQDMTDQMDHLNTAITSEIRPSLADSTEQLEHLTDELGETNQLLHLVEKLLQCGEQLAKVQQLQEAGQLGSAAELISQLRQNAQDIADDTNNELALVSALCQRALVQEEAVLHALVVRWRAALAWNAAGVLTVRPAGLADTAAGLRQLGHLQRHLRRLADDMQARLTAPLLDGGRATVARDEDAVTLSVAAADAAPDGRERTQPDPEEDSASDGRERTQPDPEEDSVSDGRERTQLDPEEDSASDEKERTQPDPEEDSASDEKERTQPDSEEDSVSDGKGRVQPDPEEDSVSGSRGRPQTDGSSEPAPDVERVYAGLQALLTALHDAALPGALMAEFGALAAPALAESLVRGPLARAIPASLESRPRFDRVIESTRQFSAALARLEFWERADTLLEYVADVDRLMVDRLCADRLEAARRLVAADLHDTVRLGHRPPPPTTTTSTGGDGEDDGDGETDGQLPHSLFRLPRCRVSRSAVAFADLVESTACEAAACPELLSARLHYTARNMLELYCALLPTLHRRQLEQLPQQAAIAHNNMQYLAHRLNTLGVCRSCLADTFLDMVPELRQVGSDVFLAALTRMKDQLLEILAEAGLEQLDTQQDVDGPAGAALRQCLHQLRHVCRLWRPVLPTGVQARAAGLLLAVVSGALTDRVLAQQDISASAAAQLSCAARCLVDEAPALFRPEEGDEEEEDGEEGGGRPAVSEAEARALLDRHTAGWSRFRELLLVLEENLRGILDRWSDGKGPLAQHFSTEEARHLVRALFQNNERRAAALAKIK